MRAFFGISAVAVIAVFAVAVFRLQTKYRQQLGPVLAGDVEGDLGARVAGAGDEHVAGPRLRRVAVGARVELQDLGIELARRTCAPAAAHA